MATELLSLPSEILANIVEQVILQQDKPSLRHAVTDHLYETEEPFITGFWEDLLVTCGPREANALALLLTCRQLHLETRRAIGRLFSKHGPKHILDIQLFGGGRAHLTWIHIPISSFHFHSLEIRLRDRCVPSGFDLEYDVFDLLLSVIETFVFDGPGAPLRSLIANTKFGRCALELDPRQARPPIGSIKIKITSHERDTQSCMAMAHSLYRELRDDLSTIEISSEAANLAWAFRARVSKLVVCSKSFYNKLIPVDELGPLTILPQGAWYNPFVISDHDFVLWAMKYWAVKYRVQRGLIMPKTIKWPDTNILKHIGSEDRLVRLKYDKEHWRALCDGSDILEDVLSLNVQQMVNDMAGGFLSWWDR